MTARRRCDIFIICGRICQHEVIFEEIVIDVITTVEVFCGSRAEQHGSPCEILLSGCVSIPRCDSIEIVGNGIIQRVADLIFAFVQGGVIISSMFLG